MSWFSREFNQIIQKLDAIEKEQNLQDEKLDAILVILTPPLPVGFTVNIVTASK